MMRFNKKWLVILSLSVIFIIGMSVYAYNEIIANKVDYKIYINGQLKEFSSPLITYEDRTYLPIREFATMLGLDVKWNQKDKIVNVTGDFNMAYVYNGLSKEELGAVLKFKNIKKGDELNKVFEEVGRVPDTGSGIMVFRYNISEKAEINIGSYDGETVWYVALIVNGERFTLTKE